MLSFGGADQLSPRNARAYAESMSLAETYDNEELTPRQQRFVEEYIISGNASDAARRAGYSLRTAHRTAQENLQKPAVQRALAVLRAKASAAMQTRKQRIEEELERIAFYRGDQFFSTDDEGNVVLDAKPDADLDVVTGATRKVRKRYGKDGELIGEEVEHQVKLADRQRALEMLGRIEGMFVDRKDVSLTVDVGERMLRARQRTMRLLNGGEESTDEAPE